MGKRIKAMILIAVMAVGLVANTIFASDTYAASVNELKQKYQIVAFNACYRQLKDDFNVKDLKIQGFVSLTTNLFNTNQTYYGQPNNETTNCPDLFEKLGLTVTNSDQENAALLRKLGYKEVSSNVKTIEFNFIRKGDDDRYESGSYSMTLTFENLVGDGQIRGGFSGTKIINGNASDGGYSIGGIMLTAPVDGKPGTGVVNRMDYSGSYGGTTKELFKYDAGVGKTYTDVQSEIDSKLRANVCPLNILRAGETCEGGSYELTGKYAYAGTTESEDNIAHFVKDAENGKTTAISNVFGGLSVNMTTEEASEMYYYYLRDFYGVSENGSGGDCYDTRSAAENAGGNYATTGSGAFTLTKLYDTSGAAKYCYVKASNHQGDEVYGVKGWGIGTYQPNVNSTVSFSDIAYWLLTHGADSVDADFASEIDDGSELEESEPEEDMCFNKSGALGWIICPVIKMASSAMMTIYDEFIAPLLQVSPQVVDALTTGNSGIYQSWGIFRDLANIVFVIMLLLVIFSQLTGFGIDNYGIKRMLPRLIVGAVLVNFSFIICQLAVDISNIVGASLQDLLVSMGRQVPIASADGATGITIGGLMVLLLEGLGLTATALVIVPAVASGISLASLLSLAMTVISGVIAVFFGMVLLGVRQAVVVLLVVTSPVAFVLYLLPNTQKYFSQWVRLSSNMLMVYPAAGLLVGGGYLAARIIVSVNGGFVMTLIGLLLLVVPYFLIIPLVKSSMSAIGNIGARISNFGNNMRRGTTSKIQESDTYKRLNTQAKNFGMAGRSKKIGEWGARTNRMLGRFGGVGRAVAGAINDSATGALARQANAAESEREKKIEELASLDAAQNPNETAKQILSRFADETDEDKRQAMLTRLGKMGEYKAIAKYLENKTIDTSEESGGFGNLDDRTLATVADFKSRDTRMRDELKKSAPPIEKFISERGLDNGKRVSIFDEKGNIREAFASHGMSEVEVAGLSSVGLALTIAGGETDQEVIRRTFGPDASDAAKAVRDMDKGRMGSLFAGADGKVAGDVRAGILNDLKSGGKLDSGVTTGKNGRKIQALTFSDGANVEGQTGAISGYTPNSGFDAAIAYKERGGSGRVILVNKKGDLGWDATNGVEISGAALNNALSGSAEISRRSDLGTGTP